MVDENLSVYLLEMVHLEACLSQGCSGFASARGWLPLGTFALDAVGLRGVDAPSGLRSYALTAQTPPTADNIHGSGTIPAKDQVFSYCPQLMAAASGGCCYLQLA